MAEAHGPSRPASPLARIAAALVVFAAALATRSFYMEDLLRAERSREQSATFRDAIEPLTQKFTFDYERRALGILEGQGILFTEQDPPRELEIAHPPGYQVFIAAVYSLTDRRRLKFVTLAQLWIDSLVVAALAFVLVGSWGVAAGTLGGVLISLSPHLASNSLVPMPDTASAWPALGALLLVPRATASGRAYLYVLAGLLIGIACWLRANALLLAPIVALLAFALRPQRGLLRPALLLLTTCLVISPITIRNYVDYDVFLPLGWGAGRTLIEGLADYDLERRFDLPKFDKDLTRWDEEEKITSHLQRETLLRKKALAVILRHPLWYAGVVIQRALFQWSYDTRSDEALESPFHTRIQSPVAAEGSLAPLRSAVRLVQGAWSTPLLRALTLLGVASLWLAGRRQDLAIFLTVPLYYFVFQSLLHTEYRYCLPVHYFLFPVIGFGMAAAWRLLRSRFQERAA